MKLKERKLHIVLLLFFLAASFAFISPQTRRVRSQVHSSQLNKIVSQNEDTTRTDYVDDCGKITVAANLGYATILVEKSEKTTLEQYYDDQGEPISRYNGYYAVLREFDDRGNNVCITYLDINGEPMIMANGYAIEKRDYNENGQITVVRYYDAEGNPTLTPLYGYGAINEYDNKGKVSSVIYIDLSGNPMMTGLGYASIKQNYYSTEGPEKGKVESEYYFDESGVPVTLSLGQYGTRKEYDEFGRESVLTYLDADGLPAPTNKGYTTISLTYDANNSIAAEQYFDLEGKPYALSEGQYGKKIVDGRTVYLNQNGEEIFNLKNLLYNHSWIAVVAAMMAVVFSNIIGKRGIMCFLIMYLCVVGYLTLMFRENGILKEPGLLLSYGKFFLDGEVRADILKNIWLFIPLGAILYRLYPRKRILLVPVILSILIESVQYFSGLGFCELDDVISNGLGGWIGFSASKLTNDLLLRIKNRMQS